MTYRETIAERIRRCLRRQEDVAPDRASKIADRDEQSHSHSSFPARGEVVSDPAQQADQSRIQTGGDEKQEGVCEARQSGVRNAQQGQKADGGDAVGPADKLPSRLALVCPDGEEDGADGSEQVDGHGQELRVRGGVAEVPDDRRCGVREGVDRDGIAPVCEDGKPDLPLKECRAERGPFEAVTGRHLAGFGTRVLLQSTDDEVALVRLEELGRLGRVG